MQSILQTRYYNLGEGNLVKYLVQTRYQAKSRGIKLPEVHGIHKELEYTTIKTSYETNSSYKSKTSVLDKTKDMIRKSRFKM